MDQHTSERRLARCSQMWAAARNFRRHHTPEADRATRRDRNKPHPQTVLKALALTATLSAAAYLGQQTATNTVHPITVIFTALSALATGTALAADIRRALHRLLTRLRPMTGRRFRKQHGDPAGWDDDEYEAYFAITATQTRPSTIRPAA